MFKPGSFWKNEKGSAMVMVCAALVLLIGITALVVDVGRFYMVNFRLGNAADAAALAGAQELIESGTSAENTALDYTEKNGITQDKVEVQANPGEGTITVRVEEDVAFLFGSLFVEEDALNLVKEATARVGSISAARGAAPLGIQDHDFEFGEKYTLKVGANDDYGTGLGVGNFGALALGGGGASRFEENLEEGYGDILSVDDVVETESGNMSNPTKRAIDERISNSHSSSYQDDTTGCPRVLLVPVFEPKDKEDDKVKSIEIISFAAFWVEEVEGQGNESEISGYFIESTTSGTTSRKTPDRGLKGVSLIK